jgi:hypothetical protein
VRIKSLPVNGTLMLNGVAVDDEQVILAADLDELTFTQAVGPSVGVTTFEFQVSDGTVFDPDPYQMTVNLLDGNYVGSDAANTYTTVNEAGEVIRGLGGADLLTGNTRNDVLFGGAGDDTLSGGTDVVIVEGTEEEDPVFSEDRFEGGQGADRIEVGALAGAFDMVRFSRADDGANAGANTGHDTVLQFVASDDFVEFRGELADLLDDGAAAATNDGMINFVTDGAVDFGAASGNEGLIITTTPTVSDADLTAVGFTDVLAAINSLEVGVTASVNDDGVIVIHGTTDSALFYYQEDGVVANDVSAGEISLLAIFDNALLVSFGFGTDNAG